MLNIFPRQSSFHAGLRLFRRLFPARRHNVANTNFPGLIPPAFAYPKAEIERIAATKGRYDYRAEERE